MVKQNVVDPDSGTLLGHKKAVRSSHHGGALKTACEEAARREATRCGTPSLCNVQSRQTQGQKAAQGLPGAGGEAVAA